MSREAMKLALEALKCIESPLYVREINKIGEAITALKQSLEQLEPEPVAVVSGYYGGKCVVLPTDPARIFNSGTAFYTHPPKREPLTDERWAVFCGICRKEWSVPYQHPGKSVCDQCVAAHGIKGEA